MTDALPTDAARQESQGIQPLVAPPIVGGISAPIARNGNWASQIINLGRHIFDQFYNEFRFIGYIAETFHSEIKAKLNKKGKIFGIDLADATDPKIKDSLLLPDIMKSKSRFIVNAIEAAAFEVATIGELFRDRYLFRKEISKVVAAETGEEKPHLSVRDILTNENPLIQSATNRLKALYTIRLLQPLTFLWGLKLGVTSTIIEILTERTAYVERNSYDRLQKLCKEIKTNQYGTWSRDSVVEEMISIIQQNRLEHHSSPIASNDIQHYLPLFRNIADRMSDKQWGMAETVYILGQIVKEPAALGKAQQTYQDVLDHTLSGIAQIKISGRQSVISSPEADEKTEPQPAFLKDIMERGPKNPAITARNTSPDAPSSAIQIAG